MATEHAISLFLLLCETSLKMIGKVLGPLRHVGRARAGSNSICGNASLFRNFHCSRLTARASSASGASGGTSSGKEDVGFTFEKMSVDEANQTVDLRGSSPSMAESYGMFMESEVADIDVLVNNYTVPAIARALRERESTLQRAAAYLSNGDMPALKGLLKPFGKNSIESRRKQNHKVDLSRGFRRNALVVLQRYLHRMPRQVFHAAERRASVVIPLCNVNGVASILFNRRSTKVKTHKGQVCFPGGMVAEGVDATIIQTSLREMEEELGIAVEKTEVLGILRCKWSEVAGMTGVAVTPVIGYVGELNELNLRPNPDEVEQLFSIPIVDLLDKSKWVHKEFSTPSYHGGPFVIWGLTGYLLHKFIEDVLGKCSNTGSFSA